MKNTLEEERKRMVQQEISARGVRSPLVLTAMRKVRRESFLPPELGSQAYDDGPLPIGQGQTISQPFIVAFMVEALRLRGGERVLEVGTGSGYAAAVLAEMGAEVYTIERFESLARTARQNLDREGYTDVHLRYGDGLQGWPEAAPFDAILVSAAGPRLPEALWAQLMPGGRLIMPVGGNFEDQALVLYVRGPEGEVLEEPLTGVRFVPLVRGVCAEA